MLDFTFTEEQELFRAAVREWCEKNLTLERVREIDDKGEIPKEIIKGMADMGLLLLTVPEEYGGAGADWITATIAAEEIGYADISLATAVLYLVEASWGFIVYKYGSETVREEAIAKATRGDAFIGIASTEPGGGSDVAAIKTTAKKEGNEWILNGEKVYISGTEEATKMGGGYFLNAVTIPEITPRHRSITAFYLPINAPGVEITKRFEDMGRMGISTGGFAMKNVKLPEEYVLGEVNKGFYYTMEGFDRARMLVAATCVGAAKRALEIGMDYIKQRTAFGRPIGKFEGIQFELADDYAELEMLRWLIYKTAWMTDEMYKKGTFTPREVSMYVSMCKLKAPKLAFDIFTHTMLWMGAYGYTKECPLEMGLRGVMSYYIGAEGAQNIQRIIIARELLGREYLPYR